MKHEMSASDYAAELAAAKREGAAEARRQLAEWVRTVRTGLAASPKPMSAAGKGYRDGYDEAMQNVLAKLQEPKA